MKRLWHFTGKDHVAGIRNEGIKPFVASVYSMWPQHQLVWLTDSPEWKQPWATKIDHDCDRSEFRVRVHMNPADPLLVPWRDVPSLYGWAPAVVEMLLSEPTWQDDSVHWWTYRGTVAPEHIKVVEHRPPASAPETSAEPA